MWFVMCQRVGDGCNTACHMSSEQAGKSVHLTENKTRTTVTITGNTLPNKATHQAINTCTVNHRYFISKSITMHLLLVI